MGSGRNWRKHQQTKLEDVEEEEEEKEQEEWLDENEDGEIEEGVCGEELALQQSQL